MGEDEGGRRSHPGSAATGPVGAADAIEVRKIHVGDQLLNVAIRHGSSARPPLLLFNGIGANWELARPFLEALSDTTAIIFDMPGIGGSPLPLLPYRPSGIARLAARLVADLGYEEVDVAGVSWGGGMAQQFAFSQSRLCRRLILAATSPGSIMVPGNPLVMLRMVTPRRYLDKAYMRKIAPELYGGAFKTNPAFIAKHAEAMHGSSGMGYLYQLLAMTGWTSLPWLSSLPHPTLILMGGDDPLVPVANGHILARLIRNARLEIIDDGHMFLLTRAAEAAKRIEEFLASETE
jgi:poly(3-hydroxyalkanoate) depolymerase